MEISGSISRGAVAIRHDMREGNELPQNIDSKLSEDNKVLECNLREIEKTDKKGNKKIVHESVESWINRRMQSAIDAYDAKQKPCRKISIKYGDYVSWHNENNKFKGKPLDLAHEWVVQVGEHYQQVWNERTKKNEILLDENGAPKKSLGAYYYEGTEEIKAKMRDEIFIPIYKKILKHFKEKFPHLEIIEATIHFDEPNGTPHLHIVSVPIGEKFGNGLQERVGFGHAIANDGIERSKNRNDDFQMERMYAEMNAYIKEQIKKNVHLKEYELKKTVKGRKHEPADKYRSPAGAVKQEVEAMQQDIQRTKAEVEGLHEQKNAVEKEITQKNLEIEEADKQIKNLKPKIPTKLYTGH